MSFVFGDSFTFRSASNDNNEYYTAGIANASPNGRGGDASANGSAQVKLPAEYIELTIGLGVTANLGQSFIVGFSNSLSGFSCGMNLDGDGRFNFEASLTNSPGLSGPSVRSVQQGMWYFLELNVQASPIHLPALPGTPAHPIGRADSWYVQCTFDFHVNGVSWLSGVVNSGTRETGDPASNYWQPTMTQPGHLNLGEATISAVGGGLMNDLYISDGAFYGDCAYTNLYPAADSSVSWTPSTGSTNNPNVNAHPDNALTYNTASFGGLTDLYEFDPLPAFNGDVLGTILAMKVIKTDGGSAQIQGVYQSGMTTVDSANKWRPGNTWRYKIDCSDVSVFTGHRWTQAELTAPLVAGIERIS